MRVARSGCGGILSVASTTTSAISPTGSETKKTQRQSALSAIQPPVSGPSTEPTPKTAPVRPCQRPRSDGGTRSPITAIASGISAPAPRPWTARARISCVIELGRAADDRARHEDQDPGDEERPPAVDVRQPPVDRHGDGRGEHVRREDPRVVLEPAEVRDDARQGGRDDRLVEDRQEHAEQHAGERGDRRPVREQVAGARLAHSSSITTASRRSRSAATTCSSGSSAAAMRRRALSYSRVLSDSALRPAARQRDHHRAPVRRILDPRDELASDEPVDHARGGRRGDAGELSELAVRQRAVE